MSSFRADLHCHTSCSDGSCTPEEILHLAVREGLQGLSITDHDTVEAYQQVLPMAKELQIEMVSGVEFSTTLDKTSIHVLGYAFALDAEEIQDLCQRHACRREERNRAIFEKLAEHNMPISEEEFQAANPHLSTQGKHTVGRPHIAQAMVAKGYVKSVQEAFRSYLAEDACCYAEGDTISTEETIEAIHRANGFVILAHPHLIRSSRAVKRLLEMDVDGIECYYAKLPPHQEKKWVEIAKERQWLITGGSDFHGEIKPHITLGCSWAREEAFRCLQQRFKENHASLP